jgi:hypothetical protein
VENISISDNMLRHGKKRSEFLTLSTAATLCNHFPTNEQAAQLFGAS